MKFFLLPIKKGRYKLHSAEFQDKPAKSEERDKSGSKNEFLNLIKAGYKKATARREQEEKLLREMRELSQLMVYYPANLSRENARNIYDDLIQSQIKKHKRWLIVDGALLPFSAILTLIPGPNVLMAYLAWRTLAHYKTKKGGERATTDLEIKFLKEPRLEKLFDVVNRRFILNRREKIKAIGEEIGISNLDRLI